MKRPLTSLALPLLPILVLAGCPFRDLDGTGTEVETCSTEPLDEVDVSAVSTDGNEIVIEAGFGGGCADHEFQLCWSGGVDESLPPQTGLTLIHDGNGDNCEAYFTQTLRFDLTPLYDEMGLESGDEVILHLNDGQSVEHTVP